jgi:hypothetical protein
MELLVVAVNAVLVGVDTFVEMELWVTGEAGLATQLPGSGPRYSLPLHVWPLVRADRSGAVRGRNPKLG